MRLYAEEDAPIKKGDMMPLMLEACPSFLPEWREFLEYWAEEECDPPLYLALMDLALHVAGMVDRNELTDMPRIFDVVERWHIEGNHYVREAATIGFLEEIISWDAKDRQQQETFERFFRPETKRFWQKLHDFWEKGIIISDD